MRRGHEIYDSILTIVDRYTKYALFIPTRKDLNAAEFAELFFNQIECHFGSPDGIVSDRDSSLTSDFWREVCAYNQIKRRLSTAFHPQTDGQSEAINRIIEDYLRAYCSDNPGSWVGFLTLGAFAYNNSCNGSIGMSPNMALLGFEPEIRINIIEDAAVSIPRKGINSKIHFKVPAAKDRVEKVAKIRESLEKNMEKAQQRMAAYYNRRHIPKQFQVDQFVKLSTKNLRLENPKLAPRWIGPFKITERIGAVAYRLALPEQYARLHDVFPVQVLEPCPKGQDQDEMLLPPLVEEPDEWEVEEIRDSGRFDGIKHYLVKWRGWPSEYNTWEPDHHLEHAPDMVKKWERSKRTAKRKAGELDSEDEEAPKQRRRRGAAA